MQVGVILTVISSLISVIECRPQQPQHPHQQNEDLFHPEPTVQIEKQFIYELPTQIVHQLLQNNKSNATTTTTTTQQSTIKIQEDNQAKVNENIKLAKPTTKPDLIIQEMDKNKQSTAPSTLEKEDNVKQHTVAKILQPTKFIYSESVANKDSKLMEQNKQSIDVAIIKQDTTMRNRNGKVLEPPHYFYHDDGVAHQHQQMDNSQFYGNNIQVPNKLHSIAKIMQPTQVTYQEMLNNPARNIMQDQLYETVPSSINNYAFPATQQAESTNQLGNYELLYPIYQPIYYPSMYSLLINQYYQQQLEMQQRMYYYYYSLMYNPKLQPVNWQPMQPKQPACPCETTDDNNFDDRNSKKMTHSTKPAKKPNHANALLHDRNLFAKPAWLTTATPSASPGDELLHDRRVKSDQLSHEHNHNTGTNGIFIHKLRVRKGGVAIAGPGGVATAGSGGTAIVGPNGLAYTHPDSLAIAGAGTKVIAVDPSINLRDLIQQNQTRFDGSTPRVGRVVATGPVIYYNKG